MLKLMIVDDEYIVRQGIRRILPWNELDIRIAGEADSVSGALGTARDIWPDIVLCDIRMPGGDGFRLVEEIRKIVPWVQFIMITAYADQKYMKQAIQLGVCDFLFKPARVEDIAEAVKRAHTAVLAYQEKKKKDQDYRNFLLDHMEVLRENLITEFLCGYADEAKMRQDASQLQLDLRGPQYQLLLIRTEHRQMYPVTQQIAMHLGAYHAAVAQVRAEPVVLAVLLNCEGGKNDLPKIPDVSAGLWDLPQTELLWSSHRYTSLQELAEAYQRYIRESVPDRRVSNEAEVMDSHLDEIEETLYEAVRYHDSEEELLRLFGMYVEQARERGISGEPLKARCRSIMKAIRVLTGIARKPGFDKPEEEFATLCREIRENQMYPLDDISGKALYYIRKRCAEDLMIEQIAAELFMSSSYLSRIIKERTGQGFGYWLNYYRIEASKEMLKNTEKSIEQVADECGYNSYRIFSENFRKYTGKTATAWRKELK